MNVYRKVKLEALQTNSSIDEIFYVIHENKIKSILSSWNNVQQWTPILLESRLSDDKEASENNPIISDPFMNEQKMTRIKLTDFILVFKLYVPFIFRML